MKISVTCPQCGSKLPVAIIEDDLGKKKSCVCPNCQKKLTFSVSMKLASKFGSDPTLGGNEKDISLIIETVPNAMTVYQSFELTSEYYTIGRKNSGGPEHRPDVEVETTDKKMSRKHAAIRKKGKSGFTLKDIGSKNGVYFNNIKLDADEEVYLGDGDTIRLGETEFRVNIAEQSDDLTQ